MKVREYDEQIEVLNLKKIIEYVKDGVTHYIMPSEYSTEESMASELIDAGFVDTIDAELKENQYLGEVYKKDGKFYRDAIDIIPQTHFEFFDYNLFTKQMREQYENEGKLLRLLQIEPYTGYIMRDIELKAFDQAKVKINARVSLGNFNSDDLRIFHEVLMKQNINLENY